MDILARIKRAVIAGRVKFSMIPLTKCPSCGSRKITRVTREYVGVYRGQPYKVPDVEFDECPDCGEQVFDREMVQRIQSHRPLVRKVRRRVAM